MICFLLAMRVVSPMRRGDPPQHCQRARALGVLMAPGTMALTRIFSQASSCAIDCINCLTSPLGCRLCPDAWKHRRHLDGATLAGGCRPGGCLRARPATRTTCVTGCATDRSRQSPLPPPAVEPPIRWIVKPTVGATSSKACSANSGTGDGSPADTTGWRPDTSPLSPSYSL